MRLEAILSGVASVLLATAPGAAQQADGPSVPPPVAHWQDPALPLLADILRQQAQLGLSPAQVKSIERLSVDFAREVIRREADWQIASLDLAMMLDPDPADPAKQLDLGRVEAKIREIERIDGDIELARLRTIEAGKAQLSAEQRAKLGALLVGDDPADPLVISLAAQRGGGGGGHSGGGGRPGGGGHPGGGGRPGGGGHPGGGGRPGGGGHPGGGWHHGGGGAPGHHPGWYGGYHGHGYGYYGYRGGYGFVGVWPWYSWGYPGSIYSAPPPAPSYWYYCPAYGAYYPDVLSCPEEWVLVPAG